MPLFLSGASLAPVLLLLQISHTSWKPAGRPTPGPQPGSQPGSGNGQCRILLWGATLDFSEAEGRRCRAQQVRGHVLFSVANLLNRHLRRQFGLTLFPSRAHIKIICKVRGHTTDLATAEQFETSSIELDNNGLSEQDEHILATLGGELLVATALAKVSRVQALMGGNAPAWFQDPTSGWGPLHFAVGGDGVGEYRDEEDVRKRVEMLLETGSPWNAVDNLGNCAGDVALSLNDVDCYTLIQDAGLRSEFMLHALQTKTSLTALRAEDNTAAGSTSVFLDSKLLYRTDKNGQEIVVVRAGDEEVGVMMGWERPIMEATVRALCLRSESEKPGPIVLNIGFGLGIIDSLFQSLDPPPSRHVIIEPHPDVLDHMRSTGWFSKPGVEILEGRWHDFVTPDKIGALLGESGGFDVIYTDTFSEDYSDLSQSFEHLGDLMAGQNSRFSFFNGLGATNATFYDVYTKLSALHLEDMGLMTSWEDVDVHTAAEGEGAWGETRKYFSLPLHRMPICVPIQ
ncbi:Arginine N-methyltransferase 2 [Ceratobasidium sp. 428]|nr:Arginine N-methyltransferase 2 [Ceratobasidium sp. 428]